MRRPTFDERVELNDGTVGIVEAFSAQLVTPWARRYVLRLAGYEGALRIPEATVEVPESAIRRIIAPSERTLAEFRDAVAASPDGVASYHQRHPYQRDPDSRRNGVADWACVECGLDEPNGNHRANGEAERTALTVASFMREEVGDVE